MQGAWYVISPQFTDLPEARDDFCNEVNGWTEEDKNGGRNLL